MRTNKTSKSGPGAISPQGAAESMPPKRNWQNVSWSIMMPVNKISRRGPGATRPQGPPASGSGQKQDGGRIGILSIRGNMITLNNEDVGSTKDLSKTMKKLQSIIAKKLLKE